MKTSCTVYYRNMKNKPARIHYNNVTAIKAGPANVVLGQADAIGNGIPENAPLIQLIFDDNSTATFNADNVTILF